MDNKWWEYYAIRYFVGTVVGAGIVAYLNYAPGSPFEAALLALSDFKDATFTGVSLFAAIGFAFCYVASAPILLLHATREHLRFAGTKTHGGLLLLALAALVALSVWAATAFYPCPPLGPLAYRSEFRSTYLVAPFRPSSPTSRPSTER
jgi:hypothetical protein